MMSTSVVGLMLYRARKFGQSALTVRDWLKATISSHMRRVGGTAHGIRREDHPKATIDGAKDCCEDADIGLTSGHNDSVDTRVLLHYGVTESARLRAAGAPQRSRGKKLRPPKPR